MSWIADMASEERQRHAERIRAAMPAELRTLADTCRERFGAKLSHVEAADIRYGRDPIEDGERKGWATVPAAAMRTQLEAQEELPVGWTRFGT